jgi:hypothetical protein
LEVATDMKKKATDIEQKCDKLPKRSEFMLGMERGRARRQMEAVMVTKRSTATGEIGSLPLHQILCFMMQLKTTLILILPMVTGCHLELSNGHQVALQFAFFNEIRDRDSTSAKIFEDKVAINDGSEADTGMRTHVFDSQEHLDRLERLILYASEEDGSEEVVDE